MIRPARATGSSTSSVLWLMVLLVFLPIATAHVLARLAEPEAGPSVGVIERAAPRAG